MISLRAARLHLIGPQSAKDMASKPVDEDEDVTEEHDRLISNTHCEKDIVQIRNLTKVYPKKGRKQKVRDLPPHFYIIF